ncbi:MAG: hypothetical protein N3E42_01210 [Candidatus Bipolaricaulota bacterium]|nr:hypothetical protein [Candidatus Bipolaricaulota bacterium]
MKTIKDWVRVGGVVTLIMLGVILMLFYREEEFSLLLGIASIGVGLGFLWHIMTKQG